MTDFPQMSPAEMLAHADRLDLEIPRLSPDEAKANFNAAFALRTRAALVREALA